MWAPYQTSIWYKSGGISWLHHDEDREENILVKEGLNQPESAAARSASLQATGHAASHHQVSAGAHALPGSPNADAGVLEAILT